MSYTPHQARGREVVAYFSRRPEHQDVLDPLRGFLNRPSYSRAVALLKAYFPRHRQGDIESLRQITRAFADKRVVRSIVDSVLENPEALERIAKASYPHPIGFDKLVFYHHRSPEHPEREFKLRLHLYWRSPQELGHELVHLHRFEMASSPITGELTNDLVRVVDFRPVDPRTGLTVHGADPRAETRDAFAYTGYQRDPDGTLHKRYLGTARLQSLGRRTFMPGDTYAQVLEHAHFVETNAETGQANGDFCSTIYIHGPGLKDDRGRSLPVLFEDHRLPVDDTLVEPIDHYSVDRLEASLRRYSRLLAQSIDFYDWLYDPRYGRDLSTGMLAGYLLSEHLGDPNTLHLWQHRYEECKAVLTRCSARLNDLVRSEAEGLDDNDRSSRYFQRLLGKARRHPEGTERWLAQCGDLKKELWRYFGALIGDYARNPDLRTLKPIWEENFRQTYGEMEGQNLRGGAHYGHIGAMIEAAFAAGDLIMGHFRRGLAGSQKAAGQGPVTQADLQAQALIRGVLGEHFPSYGFVGEEGDSVRAEPRDGERQFLVDPLDGTGNFIHGDTEFAVSIACREYRDGRWITTDGVVALPAHRELYWAEKTKGAFLIGPEGKETRLHVAGRPLATQTEHPLRGRAIFVSMAGLGPEGHGQLLSRLVKDRVRLRGNGSVAIMAAKVSGCGAHATLATAADYDVAAGRLIAEEAGAVTAERRFLRTVYPPSGPKQREFTAFLIADRPNTLDALLHLVDAALEALPEPTGR